MPTVTKKIGIGVVVLDEEAGRKYYVRESDYPDWKYVTDKINPRIGELILSRTVQLNRDKCGSIKPGDEIYDSCNLLYPKR